MGAAIALIFVSESAAQPRRGYDKVVELSPDEAAQMWGAFKNSSIAGDYAMSFTLTHSPKRGEDVLYEGEIFGARRGEETLTRLRIRKSGGEKFSDFLISHSPSGGSVAKAEGGKFAAVPKSDWFKPLVDGLIYSPFDLMMPYKNWRWRYAGGGRIGQAVYFFDLYPPADMAEQIGKVRMAITREFNSPAQTEIFSPGGARLKTVSLGSVKKIDGLWIVRETSARDDATRDKDKLVFRAAAVRTVLDSKIFSDPSAPALPELKKL